MYSKMPQKIFHRHFISIFFTFLFLIIASSIHVTGTFANIGNSLNLNSKPEYVWAPNSDSLEILGDKLTMEAWVNLSGPTVGDHWIICKWDWLSNNRSYGFLIRSTDNAGDDGKIWPYIHTESSFFYGGTIGSVSLQYNTWYHIAIVYNGTKIITYVNGEIDGEVSLTGNFTHNKTKLLIGGTLWGPAAGNTNGKIDEVRIWNIARSQDVMAILKKTRVPLASHI